MATGLFLSGTFSPCLVSLDRFVQINLTASTTAFPDQIGIEGVRLLFPRTPYCELAYLQ